MKTETREIAERIARWTYHGDPLPLIGGQVVASASSNPEIALTDYIEAALKDRDERAAKIAESSPPPKPNEPTDFDDGQRFGARLIAAAIRGKD